MNVEYYFNYVLIEKNHLTDSERIEIVNDIYNETKKLPISEPFSKELLLTFNDHDMILYLLEVYELNAILYFKNVSKRM